MNFKAILDFAIGSFTIGNILAAVIVFIIGYFLLKIIMRLINKLLEKTRLEKTLKGFVRVLIKAVIYFILIVITADALGINPTSLVAVFSVLGLAVSLAAESSLSNLASGVMMLVFKPFNVDDYIESSGRCGNVLEIGLFYTKIRTLDNKVVSIPNSSVASSDVVNYTAEEKRRVDLNFETSYDCPTDKVKDALEEAVRNVPTVIDGPKPLLIGISEYKESSIQYVVQAWTKKETYWETLYGINEAVRASFAKNGVEMTYNHLNVHLINKEE